MSMSIYLITTLIKTNSIQSHSIMLNHSILTVTSVSARIANDGGIVGAVAGADVGGVVGGVFGGVVGVGVRIRRGGVAENIIDIRAHNCLSHRLRSWWRRILCSAQSVRQQCVNTVCTCKAREWNFSRIWGVEAGGA
jgi:hypothetical protein